MTRGLDLLLDDLSPFTPQPCAASGRRNNINIRIFIDIDILINTIASRIPAARPEGSLFAVPGFLSLCDRKLHYPAEEEDDEENTEKTKTKKMKKKDEEKENGKETERDPESSTVCFSIWDDLLKKSVYENLYHPDSLMVCLRIGMTL